MRLFNSITNLLRLIPGVRASMGSNGEKYYGKYRGILVDDQDPQTRGRARLKVPSILGDEVTEWALPCVPYGGSSEQGMFMVPDIDANVWVEFEEGDLSRPIWSGTFWQQRQVIPNEAVSDNPTTRLIKTSSGHVLQFDDVEGNERIRLYHPADAEMMFDASGSISLTDASGANITINATANEITVEDANGNTMTMKSSGTEIEDSNGHVIKMHSDGITVEGAKIILKGAEVHLGDEGGEPVIKGQSFLSLFASHTHTSAPVVGGPTSPPIPQGETSALSTTVKSI